jgi:hypothetical protein
MLLPSFNFLSHDSRFASGAHDCRLFLPSPDHLRRGLDSFPTFTLLPVRTPAVFSNLVNPAIYLICNYLLYPITRPSQSGEIILSLQTSFLYFSLPISLLECAEVIRVGGSMVFRSLSLPTVSILACEV